MKRSACRRYAPGWPGGPTATLLSASLSKSNTLMRLPTAKAASLPQRDTARRAVRSGGGDEVVLVNGAVPVVVLARVMRHLPVSTPHTWQ